LTGLINFILAERLPELLKLRWLRNLGFDTINYVILSNANVLRIDENKKAYLA